MRSKVTRGRAGARVIQACFPERMIPAGVSIQRFLRGGMPLHPATAARHGAAQLRPGGAQAVQRKEDVHAFRTPRGLLDRSGPGQPLPAGVGHRMERYFSADFSDVRVHVGNEAKSIGALAFTAGSDIYFAPAQYRPGTRAGQELLGHELTHVVQQRQERVANPFVDGVAVVQDFELEAEADWHGRAALGLIGTVIAQNPAQEAISGAMASRSVSTAQARYMRLGMLAGAYMGHVPGFLLGGALGSLVDAYVGWSSRPQYIDERFPTKLEGTVLEAQKTLRDVSARNSRTIESWIARNGGGELLKAVERAKRRTANKLCTDFARNLRKELFGEEAPRMPLFSKEVLKTDGLDDIVRKVAEEHYPPGTVLLLGNDQNIHTTTIVGVIDGQTIIVEQHPANPQVVFKTMSRAMDEWRLGIALTKGQSEESIAKLFGEIGIIPRPI